MLIDCGFSEGLIASLEKLGKRVKAVFLTHSHYDHICGLNELLVHSPVVKIYTNIEGEKALYDAKLNISKYHSEIQPFVYAGQGNVELLEDSIIWELFRGEDLRVMFTPGHDVSCISYVISKTVFTGDSYLPWYKDCYELPEKQPCISIEEHCYAHGT